MADKKAPGSERAAERAAAAQQNSERARLATQPSYVNMQVRGPESTQMQLKTWQLWTETPMNTKVTVGLAVTVSVKVFPRKAVNSKFQVQNKLDDYITLHKHPLHVRILLLL